MSSLGRRLRLLARYATGLPALRRDDVLLASYPRSGNTWVRFLLAHLVSLEELGGEAVDFRGLNAMMPELGVDDLRRPWPYATIPRVVKTHRPWIFPFARCRAVLVVRDPRDTMVSFFHYARADRHVAWRGSFGSFVRSRRHGLPAWFRHHASWRDRADLVLSFERLRADTAGELGRLLAFLGAEVGEETVAVAVERSRRRGVRRAEEAGGGAHGSPLAEGFRFVRHGGSGQWREMFDEGLLALFGDLARRYGMEELLEEGRGG